MPAFNISRSRWEIESQLALAVESAGIEERV